VSVLAGFHDKPHWGALERHIREALYINTCRLPLYSQVSQGKTEPLSRKLMRYQKLSIFSAHWMDRYARKFQKHGIPIMQEDYVSMEATPEFCERFQGEPPRLSDLPRPDVSALVRDLKRARAQDDFAYARELLRKALAEVHSPQGFLCAYRHLLESLLRISTLAEQHERLAREKGAPSPRKFSWFLYWGHLPLLKSTLGFDFEAAPIQAAGIPFLANDFPPVPAESEFYTKLGYGVGP
jgi:hypothetical protein